MELHSPNISDEATDATPKHERLCKHLLRELSHGRLRPGNALPTELGPRLLPALSLLLMRGIDLGVQPIVELWK
jgi:hypothetical protein